MVSSGDNNANIVYIKQANQQQNNGMEISTGLSSGGVRKKTFGNGKLSMPENKGSRRGESQG